MPYPFFSQSGIATLVFSRGSLFPTKREDQFNQIVGVSEAGLIRVATLSPPVMMETLHFERLPVADYVALRAWVRHPLVRGKAFPFTYTNEGGISALVRWWSDTFSMPEVASGLYTVDIVLRHEVVAW